MTDVAEATERHWCLHCPDLIHPGDTLVMYQRLRDPFDGRGYAHYDCAKKAGWTPDPDGASDAEPGDESIWGADR